VYIPASKHGVEGDDEVFLLLGEVLVLQVGTQVVGVPQPAALAAPLQPCIITSCRTIHPTTLCHHSSAKTKQK